MIAVFTKYDQFKLDIEIMPEDPHLNQAELATEVDKTFEEKYLENLRTFSNSPFVCLESEGSVNELSVLR